MRIIAGTARGRTIEAPKGRGTRPTLDRVREGMFGSIQFDIEGASVLDLFAGSGALGLEALSRGAADAVFCDNSPEACRVVSQNIEALGFSERAVVIASDALAALDRLKRENRSFALVLLDPPYASGVYESALEKLAALKLLLPGCIVLAEHDKRSEIEVNTVGFERVRKYAYGDVAVTKFIYTPAADEGAASEEK